MILICRGEKLVVETLNALFPATVFNMVCTKTRIISLSHLFLQFRVQFIFAKTKSMG